MMIENRIQDHKMSEELEILKKMPIFQQNSEKDWRGFELLWNKRNIQAGETLWLQGEVAQEMAFLCDGELIVEINKQQLAVIKKGESLGELAVFTKDIRSATLIAKTDVLLLVISAENLHTMKISHPNNYEKILKQVLRRLAARIQHMNRNIARKSRGTDKAPQRKDATVFTKFWKKISGEDNKKPPSAISAMRKLPLIKDAHPTDIQDIISIMIPKFISKGTPLLLEGEIGNSSFLLIEGSIDVYRNVRGGKAQFLASLYPGALLGTGSLILQERRNASCVANVNTDVWVYEMTTENYDRLKGSAGLLWRECLLASLAFQLRSADDTLILLEQGERPEMSDYDKVRKSLSGYQG